MALPSKEFIRQTKEADYRAIEEKGTANLELKSLLDEIVQLKKALESISAYDDGHAGNIARAALSALTIG